MKSRLRVLLLLIAAAFPLSCGKCPPRPAAARTGPAKIFYAIRHFHEVLTSKDDLPREQLCKPPPGEPNIIYRVVLQGDRITALELIEAKSDNSGVGRFTPSRPELKHEFDGTCLFKQAGGEWQTIAIRLADPHPLLFIGDSAARDSALPLFDSGATEPWLHPSVPPRVYYSYFGNGCKGSCVFRLTAQDGILKAMELIEVFEDPNAGIFCLPHAGSVKYETGQCYVRPHQNWIKATLHTNGSKHYFRLGEYATHPGNELVEHGPLP